MGNPVSGGFMGMVVLFHDLRGGICRSIDQDQHFCTAQTVQVPS